MSETFRCDDKETLVAYLYGEIDASGRREVERHMRTCAACAREAEGLQAVRQDLESWLPPEADLGFTIVQNPAPVLTSSRWRSFGPVPAWARVAAAVLVGALGAAIANVQVRYGADGVVVSTGWMPPAAAPVVSAPVEATAASWRSDLETLERNLRAELAQVKQNAGPAAVSHVRETPDAAAILRRVQTLVNESEQRQRQEIAMRLAIADRDWNFKRQGDLLRINQNLGSLQGRAFAAQANQQEVMNMLRRVSAGQPIP